MTDRDQGMVIDFKLSSLTVFGEVSGVAAFAERHGYTTHRLDDRSVGSARAYVSSTHCLHAIRRGVRLLNRAADNSSTAPGWVIQMPLLRGNMATWVLTEKPHQLLPRAVRIALFVAALVPVLYAILKAVLR